MSNSGHLDVPGMDECAFCQYIAGKRPYTVLRRAQLTVTLVTREQRGISHVLVLPVRHVPTILELTADESSDLMRDIVVLPERSIALSGVLVLQYGRTTGFLLIRPSLTFISMWQEHFQVAAPNVVRFRN